MTVAGHTNPTGSDALAAAFATGIVWLLGEDLPRTGPRTVAEQVLVCASRYADLHMSSAATHRLGHLFIERGDDAQGLEYLALAAASGSPIHAAPAARLLGLYSLGTPHITRSLQHLRSAAEAGEGRTKVLAAALLGGLHIEEAPAEAQRFIDIAIVADTALDRMVDSDRARQGLMDARKAAWEQVTAAGAANEPAISPSSVLLQVVSALQSGGWEDAARQLPACAELGRELARGFVVMGSNPFVLDTYVAQDLLVRAAERPPADLSRRDLGEVWAGGSTTVRAMTDIRNVIIDVSRDIEHVVQHMGWRVRPRPTLVVSPSTLVGLTHAIRWRHQGRLAEYVASPTYGTLAFTHSVSLLAAILFQDVEREGARRHSEERGKWLTVDMKPYGAVMAQVLSGHFIDRNQQIVPGLVESAIAAAMVMRLEAAMLRFIVAREYAHVLAGHFIPQLEQPELASRERRIEWSEAQELEADSTALELVSQTSSGPIDGLTGALLVLHGAELADIASRKLNPTTSSPPVDNAQRRQAMYSRTLDSLDDELKGSAEAVHTVVDLLFKALTHLSIEELLTRGTIPHSDSAS